MSDTINKLKLVRRQQRKSRVAGSVRGSTERPRLSVFRSVKEFPQVISGLGIAVLSTSRGVLSDRQARAQNIGGELLATIA